MYAIVDNRTKEGITIGNSVTGVVNDLLVFKSEYNAQRYLSNLMSMSSRYANFSVVQLNLPPMFVNFKYFGD